MTAARPHATLFVLIAIFIDTVGFGLIMPVLPRLLMSVGQIDLPRAIAIGAWIGFAMAMATFFAAPVLGGLSDAYGRRRVLLLALAGLALDYLLLAVAHTLPLIFIGRTISGIFGGSYPWKRGIYTTVFWVGENASKNNPVHNRASSWDANWAGNYGGYDNPDPSARRNYLPIGFTPRQNPFYYALPYNDVTRGQTKPEVKLCIPWYKKTFVKEGQSICRDRWIAIKAPNGRVCYAQWSDCGPFRTDHWQYVFGNERPKPNLNKGAGLDISPAVRDYLGVGSMSVLDWRFVEFRDIPKGPWALYGENNHFVQAGRNTGERVVSNVPVGTRGTAAEARVITK